ncbi:hypothetical protein B0T26DRAFT_747667 [Lasiosphaeria miniovina]|uniref:HypA protein n=1 Tax=Lasiosphaeria miniovina TaxID=1954250 RepID=A0AA40E503_9PEZI|nr:uncharacterized protein B0T26DRAFT_747667 [Lasiosphaeria miniovina]KAK0727325.1 hypothetical protein B0T26DRAFT_747667 [Lasiosphaeria miniovina]
MATAATGASSHRVHIAPDNSGLWQVPQTEAAAKKASELLQEDMEKHHVFFNNDGFHNHIPHHILALYGTGADASALQKAYDENVSYQRPALPVHAGDRVVADFKDWDHAQKYLGRAQYYPDFLRFFQTEMEQPGSGWEAVLAKYLFRPRDNNSSSPAAADDMLVRLYSGFLHPLIQLMYGMEWQQPAIVAEALAQTAVHGNDIKEFLLESEKRAYTEAEKRPMPPSAALLDAVRADKDLAAAARMEDGNKIRDGVLARAKEAMIRIAARVRVAPDELDERTAEMFNACVYMGAAAAVHPPKHPKFDFFLMHHINASPIFATINAQPWIAATTKARVLEWKIRMDLIQYAARGVPDLNLDKIATYRPKTTGAPAGTPIETIIARLHQQPDDGHAIKLGRAARVCRDLCKPFEDAWATSASTNTNTVVAGAEQWAAVANLIVDSVEAPGPRWVRSCGFEEAWKDVPDAADAKL